MSNQPAGSVPSDEPNFLRSIIPIFQLRYPFTVEFHLSPNATRALGQIAFLIENWSQCLTVAALSAKYPKEFGSHFKNTQSAQLFILREMVEFISRNAAPDESCLKGLPKPIEDYAVVTISWAGGVSPPAAQ